MLLRDNEIINVRLTIMYLLAVDTDDKRIN